VASSDARPRWLGASTVEICAHGEKKGDPPVAHERRLRDRVEERLPLLNIVARREGFLELVDRNHEATLLGRHRQRSQHRSDVRLRVAGRNRCERPAERLERVAAGAEDRIRPAVTPGHGATLEGVEDPRAEQRGLPAAGCPDQTEERPSDEARDPFRHGLLAAEEEGRVDPLEPGEALVGAYLGSRLGHHLVLPERGILLKDGALDPLKVWTRLDPELVHEDLPGPPVGVEGLRLSADPIQRQHQLTPPPLSQRRLAHQPLQLRNQCSVRGEREPRVHAVLDGGAPKLVEPVTFRPTEIRVPESLVRVPTPNPKRLVEAGSGAVHVAGCKKPASFPGKIFESDRIDVIARRLQLVPVAAGDDELMLRTRPFGFDRPAEPRDV
jgi:hypothetical protein